MLRPNHSHLDTHLHSSSQIVSWSSYGLYFYPFVQCFSRIQGGGVNFWDMGGAGANSAGLFNTVFQRARDTHTLHGGARFDANLEVQDMVSKLFLIIAGVCLFYILFVY
uniref:Uncharacterized protein n=1 Tax=Cacopsylla melanoneura TaxID=428564 RepID=A0A8D8QCE2_9HEMI